MRSFLLFLSITTCCTISAQQIQKDTVKSFTLGEVQVLGSIPNPSTEINATEMRALDVQRVPEALNWLPGITVSESGTRNEGSIFLRGYDQRQIPVFMDGVPVYIPFDGSIDLNRLQTGNVSKIQISKGLSSLLLGGNTMGGSVNIISAQPTHKLEANVEASTLWNTSVNIGSKLDKWYFQVGASYLDRSDYRLPHSFTPIKSIQEGHKRDNSDSKDFQFNSKVGYTPHPGHEYTIGYVSIRSQKGVPTYLGEVGKRNYWKYKHWDKDQIYAFTKTPFAQSWLMENRIYYDKYYNQLRAYDDNTYTTQNSRSSFTSYYDDYTIGGSSIFSWSGLRRNTLKGGVNGKYDVHRSNNEGEPVASQKEYTLSASLEDTWRPTSQITVLGGIGYFRHKGIHIESYEKVGKEFAMVTYPTSSDNDLNYQFATDYKINNSHSVRFSFARNSRFASLKERYSYKRGRSIPNVDLKTEHSFNLDLSYNGKHQNINWYADVYYAFLNDVIQEVTGVDEEDPLVWQLQNKGKAHFRGGEFGIGYTHRLFGVQANYTLVDRVNKTDKNVRFTNVPLHKINFGLNFNEPYSKIVLRANLNINSKRLKTSDGKVYAPGYSIYNISAERTFLKSLTAKFSVYNLFDKLYYLSEGYPHEGRKFNVSVFYSFKMK